MSQHTRKTAIRARMAATGENYTTARRATLQATRATRYARTRHPAIKKQVADHWDRWATAYQEAAQFAAEHANGLPLVTVAAPEVRVFGVEGNPGGWEQSQDTGTWHPPTGTPLHEQMRALGEHTNEYFAVDGAPLTQPDAADGQAVLLPPFEVDGVVWAALGADPADGGGFGPDWEPTTWGDYEKARTKHLDEVEQTMRRLTREAGAAAATGAAAPQWQFMSYARSTHPDVLQATQDALDIAAHTRGARNDFARRYTGTTNFYIHRGFGGLIPTMVGLVFENPDERPTTPSPAAWKKAGTQGKGGWCPSKRHPEIGLWEAIAPTPPLPHPQGAPSLVFHRGMAKVLTPVIHDGAAWVALGWDLEGTPDQSNAFDARYWEPVTKAAATVAYEAAARAWADEPSAEQIARGAATLERIHQDQAAERDRHRREHIQERLREQEAASAPVHARYVRSTDPDVIADTEDRWEAWEAAHEQAVRFAVTFTGDTDYLGDQAPTLWVAGVAEKPRPGWVKDSRTKAWRPAKGTAAYHHMSRIGDLTRRYRAVPGTTPTQYTADGTPITLTTPFLHDGAAWASLTGDPGTGGGFGTQWEPVTADQYQGAATAFEQWSQARRDQITRKAGADQARIQAEQEADRARRERRRIEREE